MPKDSLLLVNLSGRGDKDVWHAARVMGEAIQLSAFVLALFFLFAFTSALPASAATLKGIPASAGGMLHLDVSTGSVFAAAVRERILLGLPDAAEQEKELGFVPARDVGDITMGILAATEGQGAPQGIILVRGRFAAGKVLKAAVAKKAKPVAIGKREFVDAGFLASSLPFAKPGKVLLGAVDDSTLLFADAAGAADSLAAFEDAGKSWVVPPALAKFHERVGKPFLFGRLEGKLFPKTEAGQNGGAPPEMVQFAMGDDGKTLRFFLESEFPAPDDARKAGASIQTLLGVWKSSSAQTTGADGKPDAVLTARYERITKLHDAAKFELSGKNLKITLEFPVAEAVALLNPGK
jgi:hypothetical protein